MAMEGLRSESLICLPDGFLTLTGSLPWVGLTYLVDLMSEQQMFIFGHFPCLTQFFGLQ